MSAQFLWRLCWYLFGIGLGIFLVLLFFGGREINFHYFPQSRVKNNILNKRIKYTFDAKYNLIFLGLDTTAINRVLEKGDIFFSKSKPRKEPCGIYFFQYEKVYLRVENCDSVAKIMQIGNAKYLE